MRPFIHRSSGIISKRYIAGATLNTYLSNDPTRLIMRGIHGRSFGSAIKVMFGILGKSMRLPLALLTAMIGGLAYIEYKLQQLSAPSWMTTSISSAREWLEDMKNSRWFKQPERDESGDEKVVEFSGFENRAGLASSSDKGSSTQGSNGNGGGNGSGYYYSDAQDDSNSAKDSSSDHFSTANGENVLLDLTKKLLEIQTILKGIDPAPSTNLQLPNIVVIGSQSSGKSSVLEAIVGSEFLPKGSNMVTRRPIELTLINTPHSPDVYGEFPQLGLDRIRDFSQIQRTLFDLNMSVSEVECVSDKPIELRIYSPNIPDLRLVDLPGYIQITNSDQPPELKKRIHGLCEKYLKEPNIILAISAADVDLANSEALLAGRRNDPLGLRTIGIITKVDKATPSAAVQVVTKNNYPLHLGYVGVICKPPSASDGSDSKALTEAQYYNQHPEFHQAEGKFGVGTLRRKLVKTLEESMSRNLSRLTDAVQSELEETKYQIKVQYNDQRITAESYIADVLDSVKQKFKQFKEEFGKPQVRTEVRDILESRVLDICAELYWNDPKINEFSDQAIQSKTPSWISSLATNVKSTLNSVASFAHIIVSDGKSDDPPSTVLRSATGASSSNTMNGSPRPNMKAGDAGPNKTGDQWDEDKILYWEHRLDRASSVLTKSGVGRWTTQRIVDILMDKVESMINGDPFTNHPDAQKSIVGFSHEILRAKYHSTIDQVENTIKPFKYEIEVEPFEWEKATDRTKKLIDNEISLCRKALQSIRSSTSKKRLNAAIKYVNSKQIPTTPKQHPTERAADISQVGDTSDSSHLSAHSDTTATSEEDQIVSYPHFSPQILRKAQTMVSLRDRLAILYMRRQAINSTVCKSSDNKLLCPEIFLDVVAEKLTYNAALFINFELLHEFFFQFPRALDSQLYYTQSRNEAREFADQNPNVKQHLNLLDRRSKLEEALARLRNLALLQESLNDSKTRRRFI
ncbi:mitochondrial dynamin GTPase Msp1 [Mycoemilia scoparia]|uniref:dynamin GTPase n=1 Tax=Mycoemilia scoparia TaxID=417184 RepID=A0A9W8A3A0_9FUNG|nr:mitochondrial dynamin GTPase Msp1 [Mycoemilia scoparia]